MNTLGEKLRLLRMIKNITQAQLAKELGIGVNSVNRYENNVRTPKEKVLKKLSEYYGVSIDDFR
ncbi:transcriptional regulator with XRE-family HTH domain [Bacillus mesophilus]|uniref:Helix-turn-helix transcriptional regulator n=1 Tax=Bacillus mesophilus TaxID=1808955 RepID=A0A6M0QAV8_9BACI|nr:helix-turn-helix transcriptional regulator [Bacillus mesophilus]MBM7662796.1 transcriptional regulator with XRE-family HTH domain [Bacillus mesophilus]NEY73387.1 helix-turn-helix transcriptional regulator [Bacillus mesophilus]